jgi:N-acetylglucosaminyl-diphospho-decaprenol L-rhamnosyltransferase
MSVPDLSIVVVTHNGRELALQTLRSARANAGPIAVEWLVADSGSGDGTPEAIEDELPDARVFRCANLGFAHANNVALRAARGRYVLLLNPDVEIEKGTFALLVSALDERTEVGAASVLQRGADGRPLPSIRRFPSPVRDLGEALLLPRVPLLRHVGELDIDFDRYFDERQVDWLSGAFLVARREAVEQVGPLDERFFLYSEEIDWCYRIRRAGWDVRHLPVMEVTHHCGRNSPERVAELGHSRVLFARKHFGRGRAAAIHAALALNHLLRLAILAPLSVFTSAHRARLRAEAFGLAAVAGVMRPPLSTGARAMVERGGVPNTSAAVQ